MAAVTIQKRASGKGHFSPVVEGTDSAILSDIERTTAGTASLWADAFTTTITIGAAGTPVTVDDNLIVSGEIRGPSDGTGIVIGQTGASANTGSAAQLQSFTTTQRDNLTAANGMMILNATEGNVQIHQSAAWVDFTSGGSATAEMREKETPGERFLFGLGDYTEDGNMKSQEIQYTRVWLQAGLVVDRMRVFQVDGGAASGMNIRLGIYDQTTPTSETGVPVNRVAQTNSSATVVGGDETFKTVSLIAAYTVTTTGYYWLAVIVDNESVDFEITRTTRKNFAPVRRESGSGLVLPATVGTITNSKQGIFYVAGVEQ